MSGRQQTPAETWTELSDSQLGQLLLSSYPHYLSLLGVQCQSVGPHPLIEPFDTCGQLRCSYLRFGCWHAELMYNWESSA